MFLNIRNYLVLSYALPKHNLYQNSLFDICVFVFCLRFYVPVNNCPVGQFT